MAISQHSITGLHRGNRVACLAKQSKFNPSLLCPNIFEALRLRQLKKEKAPPPQGNLVKRTKTEGNPDVTLFHDSLRTRKCQQKQLLQYVPCLTYWDRNFGSVPWTCFVECIDQHTLEDWTHFFLTYHANYAGMENVSTG